MTAQSTGQAVTAAAATAPNWRTWRCSSRPRTAWPHPAATATTRTSASEKWLSTANPAHARPAAGTSTGSVQRLTTPDSMRSRRALSHSAEMWRSRLWVRVSSASMREASTPGLSWPATTVRNWSPWWNVQVMVVTEICASRRSKPSARPARFMPRMMR